MAQKCPICGSSSLETKTGEFRFDPPQEIPGGTIIIQNAEWEECGACSEVILSLDLEHAIEKERYRRLGLLPPQDILEIRKCAGLSQTQMAKLLGVGEKTYTRWESGSSLQNKSSDNLIRLVATNADLFPKLEAERNPEREKQITEYLKSLESIEGRNPAAIAAHGGELDPSIGKELRRRLLEIIRLKRSY